MIKRDQLEKSGTTIFSAIIIKKNETCVCTCGRDRERERENTDILGTRAT